MSAANANLGTCNYDGFSKHKLIGKGALVGTNSSLVAPVKPSASP
jgi:bifunctional UDP-N-acetylglucosamine pyrophosphorylase/glucosamine-1-phosphate N-acetyltransferase